VAIGDISDFVRRLRAALPTRWFPDIAPVLTGMLTGFAEVWAFLYALLIYVIQQSRIATATGVFLDIIALDFFQGRIIRNVGEPDTHFRLRILSEILRPRATRAAVSQALTDLTGIPPIIFEPSLTSDTGGYNLGGVGYNVAGGWGSLLLPFQAFITAFRPSGGGISGVSGYGNIAVGISTTGGLGGYGQGAIEWADLEMVQGAITDADIYATVAAAMPAATIGWTQGLAASQAQIQQSLQPVSGFTRAMSSARGVISIVAGALFFAAGKASGIATALLGVNVGPGRGGGIGISQAAGRTGSLLVAIAARGFGGTTGRQLYGNVAAIGGRGTSRARGRLTTAGTAAQMAARGRASSNKNLSIISTAQALPTAPGNLTASNATPNTMTLTWSPSTGAP
jgi:hypothetical protein